MKILLIEDDLPSRTFMSDLVESSGHLVQSAPDGLAGLEVFKQFQPDLVITDIMMPKMDGIEFLQEIRQCSPHVIVIMVTAFSSDDFAVQALNLGANNYLKKPIREKELFPLLEKYSKFFKFSFPPKVMLGTVTRREVTMEFENEFDLIPAIADQLVEQVAGYCGEERLLDARIGLVELLNNSIEHGNFAITPAEKLEAMDRGKEAVKDLFRKKMSLPKLSRRRVTVDFKMDQTLVEWVITDQGKGFNWKKIIARNPSSIEFKGIFICQYHFDELIYLGAGNKVCARIHVNQRSRIQKHFPESRL